MLVRTWHQNHVHPTSLFISIRESFTGGACAFLLAVIEVGSAKDSDVKYRP